MANAFLSHSSLEKEYVTRVATRLKRSGVVFDAFNFEAGVDFRKAIRDGLDSSSLFVLFASRRALDSVWVNFELDEAEVRYIEGKISGVLVMTIGSDVTHEDLPTWLKRALVIPAPGPAQAARLIQDKLLKDQRRSQPIFVGREDELRVFSERIGELGMDLPQVLAFTGLEGVGRRTFAQHALLQNLSLKLGPVLTIYASEGLEDLHLDLLDENMELLTKEQIAESIALFRRLDSNEQAMEIARQLSLFSKYNVSPVIVDHGALLSDDGVYVDRFAGVMEALKRFPEVSLVLIQTRYPQLVGARYHKNLVFPFRVRPLSNPATTRLLQHYLRNSGVRATNEQVEEVASYLDGYPPAVVYATAYAQEYTMDSLVADKTLLTDFKAGAFTEFLKRIRLQPDQITVLKTLAVVPPVALPVLAAIVDKEQSDLVKATRDLVDASVVLVTEGRFTIAAPVREAVWRTWGNLTKQVFSDMANRLKKAFWDPNAIPDLSTVEVLIFSLLRAQRDKELEEFAGIVMPSTLLQGARAAYDNREWGRARDLAKQALVLDPEKDAARVILFKSLVRENEPSEEVLAELRSRRHKSVHYLSGFRAWKKGEFKTAVRHYQDAILAGDESNSVYRELAECQYWLGDLESAQRSLSVVLNRGKPNPYVLDLAAKVSTDRGEFASAEHYISIQELVDRPENVAHRKAALCAAKGQWEQALAYANQACGRIPPLPETFFLRARVLIELGAYKEAERALDDIQNSFRGVRLHVQLGLRCKLLLRKGDWREAEIVYQRLTNKETPVNRGLRAQILRQKIADIRVGSLERQEAQRELIDLETQKMFDLFDFRLEFDIKRDDDI